MVLNFYSNPKKHSFIAVIWLLIDLFIYKAEWQRKREKQEERETPMYRFTSQMAIIANYRPGQSQELHPALLHRWQEA